MRALLAGVISLCIASSALARPDPIAVHEWGTFTALQDETGRAIGGINEDVEPLPPFVHDVAKPTSLIFSKGLPLDDAITMRLETPVVYFHLPPGSEPQKLDFAVEFRGGLLSQFYPVAMTNVPANNIPKITPEIVGRLKWTDLRVGKDAPGPKTDSHVWLAPRKVEAADITTSNGESERYLFYRGVGAIDSPVRALRIANGNLRINGTADVRDLWYFDLRDDGRCAFRKLDVANQDKPGVVTPAEFDAGEYRDDSFAKMRSQMKSALASAGLFDDEAEAMLNAWDASYFKSPGTRVFFIAPKQWVEDRLPLKLSVPAKVERVFIGRIDLVTPKHRGLVTQLKAATDDNTKQQIYTELGRFAGPIIRDASRQ